MAGTVLCRVAEWAFVIACWAGFACIGSAVPIGEFAVPEVSPSGAHMVACYATLPYATLRYATAYGAPFHVGP